MSLSPSTRLGPYEILSLLGRGGMGEVYKARDTRLDRFVAVKTIRADLADSGDARERFEREARAISKLSHPHICALFDVGHADGIEYLVMEWLEGETLVDRIANGPLPMASVLGTGAEIAGALSVAHRQGIVHRDLKPGNVMVTRSGVKLLDFGLAKMIEAPASVDPADEATVTGAAPLTAKGTWLGTAPYMAPEQIQGRPVDARSDIFALGAVLYEMATGRRAFPGRTPAEIVSAVLHQDPASMSSALAAMPPAFDRLVRECLAKDPEKRWQAAHDVALQLASIGEQTQPASAAPVSAGRVRAAWLGWVVAASATVIAVLAWWPSGRAQTPGAALIELQLAPPANGAFSYSPDAVTFALSPDGTQLAFIATAAGGDRRVWMRSPTSIAAKPVAGTETATSVFWSPDGQSIAFFASGALKRLDLASGAAVPVCSVKKLIGYTGTWSPEGQILYASVEGDAIYRVPTGGGVPTAAVAPDPARDEARILFPTFLPDGRRFLYFLRMTDGTGWSCSGRSASRLAA